MESAETISAGISAAIASATALLPDAVGPNRASTSGSGGDERLLRSAKRRRRGAGDQHSHELAGCGDALEVDGRVAARPAAEERWIRTAGPLDEHFLAAADPTLVAVRSDALDELD